MRNKLNPSLLKEGLGRGINFRGKGLVVWNFNI
jgi:hypothetical protein